MRFDFLPVTKRMELYNRAQVLREKYGLGTTEIARKLGMKRSTVNNWVYTGKKPERSNRNFPNLSPSPELRYILGVCYGDASIFFHGGHYNVRLGAIDRDFVEEFNRCVSKVLGRCLYPIYEWEPKGNGNTMHHTGGSSKLFYEFLKQPLEKHKSVVEKHPKEFIQGFFDSEGGVYNEGKSVKVAAFNTNEEIIAYLRYLLHHHFSIRSCVLPGQSKNKPYFTLAICSQMDVWKFRRFIGFTIARKRKRLEEAHFPLLERVQKYHQAIKLRKEGLTYAQIARRLRIKKRAVEGWFCEGYIPDRMYQNRLIRDVAPPRPTSASDQAP